MKFAISALLSALFLTAALPAQTIELGQKVFLSREGEITVVIDAALAAQKMESPYVMFMAFFVAPAYQSLSIHRDDVALIYKGQEIKMPSYEEWRKKYRAAQSDLMIYNSLGKETLILSELRNFYFPWEYDFFSILGREQRLTDEGSFSGMIGFRTKLYFKNPGFKKGEEFVITVRDRKNPEITGSCAVVF